MSLPPPRSTLFPYTTLFRSGGFVRVEMRIANECSFRATLPNRTASLTNGENRRFQTIGGPRACVLQSGSVRKSLRTPANSQGGRHIHGRDRLGGGGSVRLHRLDLGVFSGM